MSKILSKVENRRQKLSGTKSGGRKAPSLSLPIFHLFPLALNCDSGH